MKKTSIKNIVIIVGIGVVLFVLYMIFLKPSPAAQTGSLASSTGAGAPTPAAGQAAPSNPASSELLAILTSLQGLELNDSILFNPAYRALQDISIPLVREGNEGRRNPFAPIGSDPVVIDITPTTSTSEEETDAPDQNAPGMFGAPAAN